MNGNKAKTNGKNGKASKVAKDRRGGNQNGNAMVSQISYPSTNGRPVRNRSTNMSGSDFYSRVEVSPGLTGAGRIVASFPISPSAFIGTRLAQLSNLYEFYRFNSLVLRWVPAVPTTLACQFVLYVDLDPRDDPTNILDEDALIRQAVAQTGSQQWNFHVPKRITMALRNDRQLFFTGVDGQNVRFSQQGKAYLIQVTNPVNFNGDNISSTIQAGSLFIDWNVAFAVPQINPSAVVRSSLNTNWSQSQTVQFDDLDDGDAFTITGLEPLTYYVATTSVLYTDTAFPATLEVDYVDDVDQATSGPLVARLSLTGNQLLSNLRDSTDFAGGFMIIQSDSVGSTNWFRINSTGGATLQTAVVVMAPLFTSSGVFTARRQAKRNQTPITQT